MQDWTNKLENEPKNNINSIINQSFPSHNQHINITNIELKSDSLLKINGNSSISSALLMSQLNLATYSHNDISNLINANVANIQHRKKYHRNPFSIEEDNLILSLVNLFGDNNWKLITKYVNQMDYERSSRQCKERYFHYLDPKINNSIEWTNDEDELLLHKVEKEGKKWKRFEIFFKGRTDVSLRNRYNLLIRRKNKNDKKTKKKNNIMSDNYSFLDFYYSSMRKSYSPKKEIEKNTIEDNDISLNIDFSDVQFSDDDSFLSAIQSSDDFDDSFFI